MASLTYDDIEVGNTAEMSRTIAESDVYQYAGLTGDVNPAHLNEVYAASTVFEKRIAHGMLVAGLISSVLGNQLPGNGTIYVSQSVKFLAPVYFGDTITAQVEVVEKLKEKKRVILKTMCVNQDGITVMDGEAVVSPRRP